MAAKDIIFKQLELGPMGNCIYLIGCARTREAAVIDPAWDASAIRKTVQDLELELGHILVTHAHPDHINALEEMLDTTDAAAYMNSEEIGYMRTMTNRYQVPTGFMARHSGKIHAVGDEEEIRVGDIAVRCIHTPGHTPGSQCFLAGGHLFSGDTLFVNACGRVDLPGGDAAKMWWSLNHRLRALDDDLILHPGHDEADRPSSTLGDEKRRNPYLQFDSVDQFLRMMGGV